ncbi:hypothetical protein OEZ85_001725 [Tetradesmus obliquus]|uniref:AP2/ERF domain-containing protein n=1 Tax=Tetradesmus obliquus TaxID=3088 RepID=A0ABY8U0Q1_TETOB|nr:hypothetical protein OEZ85_001725 [Tetradesmus obliquus]
MKVTGPGCVSHAQNPTGQMGVRMRKNRYEAFIAVPPFRYLYLGQHITAAEAARTRDTAMLAIFGPEAAAAHGSAWLSPGAAGSIAADEVAAMAAKLARKEQAASVMKLHGTYKVVVKAVPAAAAAANAAAQESGVAMAAKLAKKEQAASVMKLHGTYKVVVQAVPATAAAADAAAQE